MATIKEELDGIKKDIAKVSKASAEMIKAQYERKYYSLIVVIVCLSILLIATACAWLYRENQFEKVVETTETVTTFEGIEQIADGGGSNSIVGGDYYGNAEN